MARTGLLGTSSSRPGDILFGSPGTSGGAPPVALSGLSAAQTTVSGTLVVLPPDTCAYSALEGFNYGGLEAFTYAGLEQVCVSVETPLAGSTAGSSTTSGTLVFLRLLTASTAGRATVASALSMTAITRQLVGSSAGRATVTTRFGKIRRLTGTSHGVADLPRIRIKLTKPKMLTGSSTGRATAVVSLLGKRRALAGTTNGRAMASATLSARRVLAGRTDGGATVTTFLYRPPRRDVFLGIARADSTATTTTRLSFQRALVGSSGGVAMVAAPAFGQSRQLAGLISGVGTASAWLALATVTLPLTPAETFVCLIRTLAYRAQARPLVHSAPERELVFTAELRD